MGQQLFLKSSYKDRLPCKVSGLEAPHYWVMVQNENGFLSRNCPVARKGSLLFSLLPPGNFMSPFVPKGQGSLSSLMM